MAGPNSSFTELAAITIDEYSAELWDNVTNNLPLLYFMKKSGNVGTTTVDGGVHILENLEYGDNASFKWFSGYEELSVTPTDAFTAASFDWKQCNANVIFSGKEVAINSGPAKQFDLIKSKTSNAENTIRNNLGAALFYAGTEYDGKAIGGLQLLVADTANSGTVGGINRATSTNAFWRNQTVDLSDENITISSTTIKQAMALAYRRASRNGDVPNVIVAGDTYHSYWEDSIQTQQVFQNTDTADAGFYTQRYKRASVVYDPNCSSTRMYVLNTKYLKLKAHSAVNMTRGEPRRPTNQDATVIPINWMGNMTVSNPSLQCVIKA